MRKRLIPVIMAMVMTLSVTPVFAQTVQSDIGADQNYSVEVMSRAPICPRCGGITTSKVVWGEWTNKKLKNVNTAMHGELIN